jgi:hypothetical protein
MTPDQLKAQRPYDIAGQWSRTGAGIFSVNEYIPGRYTQESAQQLFSDAVRRFSSAIDKVETERGTVIGPMPQEAQTQGSTGPTYGPSYKEFLDANAQASAQASGPRAEASAYIAQLQETLRLMKMTRDEREVEQALQRAGVDLTNEEATAVRALVEQQQELSRTQADNEQRMAQLRAEAKAHYAEEAQRQKQRYEDYKNNATAQYDYLESLRDQTRIAGMSNEEGQKELAVLQAINIAKQNNQTLSESEKQRIRDQIDLQQQLSRLKEISASVDSALSGAFTGFITGAQTARQAVAALIQQMIALASQQAFRGATSSLFNLFAPTGNQVSSSLPNGGMSLMGRDDG